MGISVRVVTLLSLKGLGLAKGTGKEQVVVLIENILLYLKK